MITVTRINIDISEDPYISMHTRLRENGEIDYIWIKLNGSTVGMLFRPGLSLEPNTVWAINSYDPSKLRILDVGPEPLYVMLSA